MNELLHKFKLGNDAELLLEKRGGGYEKVATVPIGSQALGVRNSAQGVVKVTSGEDVLAVSTLPTPAASVRLKDAAAALGIKMGAAFDEPVYAANATYAQLLRDECDLWTPENSMKDARTWTAAGTWDFSGADAFMAIANAAGKPVRGHTLMYPDHPPSWQNSGNVTAANWEALIDAHMSQCCPRYPTLVGLDVINELFLIGTSAPFANGYKDSVWLKAAQDGDVLMAHCFERARHYAPPGMPLFYCDNGTEQGGDSSRNAQKNNMVAALTRARAAGVPIDGFSSQWHVVVDPSYQYRTDRAKHRDFLKSLVDLGLIINITEIDVRMPAGGWSGSAQEFDRRAAELLAATLETYFSVVPEKQRQHISFWNLGDTHNAWGVTERPCPFDTALARKSMYAAALNTFLGAI